MNTKKVLYMSMKCFIMAMLCVLVVNYIFVYIFIFLDLLVQIIIIFLLAIIFDKKNRVKYLKLLVSLAPMLLRLKFTETQPIV